MTYFSNEKYLVFLMVRKILNPNNIWSESHGADFVVLSAVVFFFVRIKMMAFLNLSKYVVLNLLKEWLFIREIGKLKIALSKENGLKFKSWLKNSNLTFYHKHSNTSEVRLISWIVSLNINVDMLYLNEKSSSGRNISKLLKDHIFSGLKVFRIACGPGYKSFHALLDQSPTLKTLEVVNASNLSVIAVVQMLEKSPKLRKLSLELLPVEWDISCFQTLTKHCRYITKLTLIRCHVSVEIVSAILKNLLLNSLPVLKFDVVDYKPHVIGQDTSMQKAVIANSLFKFTKLHFYFVSCSTKFCFEFHRSRDLSSEKFIDTLYLFTTSPMVRLHVFSAIDELIFDSYPFNIWALDVNDNVQYKVNKVVLRDCAQVPGTMFLNFSVLQILVINNAYLQLHSSQRMLPQLREAYITHTRLLEVEMWLSMLISSTDSHNNVLKVVIITLPTKQMNKPRRHIRDVLDERGVVVTYIEKSQ